VFVLENFSTVLCLLSMAVQLFFVGTLQFSDLRNESV